MTSNAFALRRQYHDIRLTLRYMLACILAMLSCVSGCALAQSDNTTVSLSDADLDIPVSIFGNGDIRLLWLPGALANNEARIIETASHFIDSSFELWLADLHTAYFVPSGRASLLEMPPEDVAQLIAIASPPDNRPYFIVSSGRGAALTLIAWQHLLQSGDSRKPDGLIFISPNFQAATQQPGKPVQYLDIIDQVRAPIYIIQPGDSGKRWRIGEVADRLNRAGSQTFIQIVPGISDDFHIHPEARPREITQAGTLPGNFAQATKILGMVQTADPAGITTSVVPPDISTWSVSEPSVMPAEATGRKPAPQLVLNDLSGKQHRLSDYRGKVVLLNFWATWCPPCIEEIPALGRLSDKLASEQFALLSVDIAEDHARVSEFLKKVPARYPVLMDPDGDSVDAWQLYAFPSTFIIDRKGHIRYIYYGGLDWDKQEIVQLIESLQQE